MSRPRLSRSQLIRSQLVISGGNSLASLAKRSKSILCISGKQIFHALSQTKQVIAAVSFMGSHAKDAASVTRGHSF